VAGICEHSNELSISMKDQEFLDHFSNFQLLNNDLDLLVRVLFLKV
jgi:hypothetical protein